VTDIRRHHCRQCHVGTAADQRGVFEHRPARDAETYPVVHVDQWRRGAVGESADDPCLVGDQLVDDVMEKLHLAAARALVQGTVE